MTVTAAQLASCENGMIAGQAGPLEIVVDCPERADETAPVVIICHPHPLYGGTLSNKVVHILASAFNRLGLVAVRFNFRGVGRSAGKFDNAVGEVDDLASVVEWVRLQRPAAPVWLAGFSFGAYVALKAHAELGAERLLLVAPPLSLYSVADIPPVKIPWLVIQGGADEVIDAEQVRQWLAQQTVNPPQLVWLDEAGHFFHGRLNDVRDAVQRHWPGR